MIKKFLNNIWLFISLYLVGYLQLRILFYIGNLTLFNALGIVVEVFLIGVLFGIKEDNTLNTSNKKYKSLYKHLNKDNKMTYTNQDKKHRTKNQIKKEIMYLRELEKSYIELINSLNYTYNMFRLNTHIEAEDVKKELTKKVNLNSNKLKACRKKINYYKQLLRK